MMQHIAIRMQFPHLYASWKVDKFMATEEIWRQTVMRNCLGAIIKHFMGSAGDLVIPR